MTIDGGARQQRLGGLRLLVWAAVAVLLVDLLFLTGTSNFLASPQARILNQLILLGVGIAVAVAIARRRLDPGSPLLLPGLAWIAASVLAAVLSQRTATSLEAVAILLLAAPAYVAVRAVLWSDWLRPRVDRLLVAATALFLVAYLLQVGSQWVRFWSVMGPAIPPLRPGDVGLTIGTVNAVALHLELLVPVAAWLAWRRMGSPRLGAAIAVLGLVSLVITASRGAWLGAAAGAVVAGGVAWLRAGRPLPSLRGGRRIPVLTTIAVVLIIAVVAVPVLGSRLLSGDAGRFELWAAALSMFASSPMTGTGPGTFPALRPLTTISDGSYAVLTTSHNSVLQVLVDAGVVGIAAAGILVAAVTRLGVRALARARADAQIPGGLVLVIIASLVAMLVHSTLDTQFHVPAVVLLVLLLVARLDPPTEPGSDPTTATAPAPRSPVRAALPIVAVLGLVAAGAIALVPVDIAMVRAQLGNVALARGDTAAALDAYRSAAALHELAPYRLGEGLAAERAGDAGAAAQAYAAAERIAAFTFVTANRASVAPAPERAPLLDAIEAAGTYDVTALLNVAAMREGEDPDRAAADLAAVMALEPSLVFSTPPDGVFSEATWAAAQASAIEQIGLTDPAGASAVARIAGEAATADAQLARVQDADTLAALGLLDAAIAGGTPDLEAARALIRSSGASPTVIEVLWLAAFQGRSQPLIDAISDVTIPVSFAAPPPPLEVVVAGAQGADYSVRLPRYPMASDFRLGPARPYGAGLLTIEPVFRPK